MQLYSLNMHENETLSSVVNRLKRICTQLAHIECNIDKYDKIAILQKSLPMQFENIVIVLKKKEPIPSLETNKKKTRSITFITLMRYQTLKLYLSLPLKFTSHTSILGKQTMFSSIATR